MDVLNSIGKLNAGKADGNGGLTTDHFINASEELSVHVSFLFSGLLTHGTVPEDMSLSTVILIPKGRNCSLVDSTNYRGIALSSIFGKLFDLIMLSRNSDKLLTSDLQFGFKAKRSTSMCTMVLKEVISYYINN